MCRLQDRLGELSKILAQCTRLEYQEVAPKQCANLSVIKHRRRQHKPHRKIFTVERMV